MRYIKLFEEFNMGGARPEREPDVAEPETRPSTMPKRPEAPEEPNLDPEYDPNYNPDEEGIERPVVDPDTQASGEKTLKKVVNRYLKEK